MVQNSPCSPFQPLYPVTWLLSGVLHKRKIGEQSKVSKVKPWKALRGGGGGGDASSPPLPRLVPLTGLFKGYNRLLTRIFPLLFVTVIIILMSLFWFYRSIRKLLQVQSLPCWPLKIFLLFFHLEEPSHPKASKQKQRIWVHINLVPGYLSVCITDRGDHFKVVGLRNLAKTNKH